MTPAGQTPDPWQEKVLRSDADRLLLLCGRQCFDADTVVLARDEIVPYLVSELRAGPEIWTQKGYLVRAVYPDGASGILPLALWRPWEKA